MLLILVFLGAGVIFISSYLRSVDKRKADLPKTKIKAANLSYNKTVIISSPTPSPQPTLTIFISPTVTITSHPTNVATSPALLPETGVFSNFIVLAGVSLTVIFLSLIF